MSNRGTPFEVNPGQLATITSRFILALPRALELSGLETKKVLDLTCSGHELSSALSDMLRDLTNPSELTIHRSPRGYPTVNWPIMFFDDRNLKLTKINPALIQIKGIENTEVTLTGSQMRRKLLDEGFLLLDSAVMDALLAYPKRIPEEMKMSYGWGTRRIFFDGAVVQDPNGIDRSFFMQFHPTRNVWKEDDLPLENVRTCGDYVAVMKL